MGDIERHQSEYAIRSLRGPFPNLEGACIHHRVTPATTGVTLAGANAGKRQRHIGSSRLRAREDAQWRGGGLDIAGTPAGRVAAGRNSEEHYRRMHAGRFRLGRANCLCAYPPPAGGAVGGEPIPGTV